MSEMRKLGGNYLTAGKTKTGEIFIVKVAPTLVDSSFKDKNDKPRQRYQIGVTRAEPQEGDDTINDFNVTLNTHSSDLLIDQLGNKPNGWLNKRIQVEIIDALVAGVKKKILLFKKAE